MPEAKEVEVLRIGLLGCSDIAPAAVIKPSLMLPEVEVVACAARDFQRAQKYAKSHGIPRAFASYEELIKDPEIDAIYISLPNSLHCKWALECFAAGKHVLCEKPMASNAEEAQQMAAAAKKNGVFLMEAYHWMYHPMAARIKELVKRDIDKIKHIEAIMTFPIFRGSDIRYNYALGGGALMDAGCYCVSAIRYFLEEEPEMISAQTKLAYPNVDQDTEAIFHAPSGATAKLKVSLFSFPSITLKIEGMNGTVISVTNWVAPHMFYNLLKVTDGMGNWREEKFSRLVSTYQYQLKAFAAAIKSGNFNVPSSPAFGVANQSVIDAIYAKLGLPIRGTEVPADAAPAAAASASNPESAN